MKKIVPIIIIVLLFLGGAGMVLYPVVSSWYMNLHQGQVVADYDEEAAKLSQEQIEEELEKARKYNESLLGNVVLTDPFDAEALDEQNTDYEDLLNIGGDGVMGSIEIPSQDIYLPIYHGTSSESLEKGAGHLQNSSLPVGGKGTHAVISGHTALPTAEMFNNLSEVKEGDVFYIHVLGQTLAYEVNQIKIVLPEDISDLLIDKNEDYVTLVTCTPYGINSHRLLVRGTRIPYEEAQQKVSEQQKKWNPMWNAYIAAAVLAIVLLTAGGIRYRMKKAGSREHHEK